MKSVLFLCLGLISSIYGMNRDDSVHAGKWLEIPSDESDKEERMISLESRCLEVITEQAHLHVRQKINRDFFLILLNKDYLKTKDRDSYIRRISAFNYRDAMEKMARIVAKEFDQIPELPCRVCVGCGANYRYIVEHRKRVLAQMARYTHDMQSLIWKYRK